MALCGHPNIKLNNCGNSWREILPALTFDPTEKQKVAPSNQDWVKTQVWTELPCTLRTFQRPSTHICGEGNEYTKRWSNVGRFLTRDLCKVPIVHSLVVTFSNSQEKGQSSDFRPLFWQPPMVIDMVRFYIWQWSWNRHMAVCSWRTICDIRSEVGSPSIGLQGDFHSLVIGMIFRSLAGKRYSVACSPFSTRLCWADTSHSYCSFHSFLEESPSHKTTLHDF